MDFRKSHTFTYFASKSSIESISIYSGTERPIFAPVKFAPKSTSLSSCFSKNSLCVIGNHAATVASASPFANDSKTTATSTGVTFTSNPTCSIASFTTPDDALSESHGVETSSIDSPSPSTPSIQLETLSSFSSTQRTATSSTSSPVSSASYIISSISSTSHLNCDKNL